MSRQCSWDQLFASLQTHANQQKLCYNGKKKQNIKIDWHSATQNTDNSALHAYNPWKPQH